MVDFQNCHVWLPGGKAGKAMSMGVVMEGHENKKLVMQRRKTRGSHWWHQHQQMQGRQPGEPEKSVTCGTQILDPFHQSSTTFPPFPMEICHRMCHGCHGTLSSRPRPVTVLVEKVQGWSLWQFFSELEVRDHLPQEWWVDIVLFDYPRVKPVKTGTPSSCWLWRTCLRLFLLGFILTKHHQYTEYSDTVRPCQPKPAKNMSLNESTCKVS